MTIWEDVNAALVGLSVPMGANSFIVESGDDLPDEYLVYEMISDPELQSADDLEKLRWYRIQISYFNRSGLISMPDIVGSMISAGFRRLPARELPYNRETRHYGLALDFSFLEEVT